MHVFAMMSCVFSGVAMTTASRPSLVLSASSLSRLSYVAIFLAVAAPYTLFSPLRGPVSPSKMRLMLVGRMSHTATISLNSGLWSPTSTPPSSPHPMSAVRTALLPFHDW